MYKITFKNVGPDMITAEFISDCITMELAMGVAANRCRDLCKAEDVALVSVESMEYIVVRDNAVVGGVTIVRQ